MKMNSNTTMKNGTARSFFSDGMFDWQIPRDKQDTWARYVYNPERWWGDFPKDSRPFTNLGAEFPWAVGPFAKHPQNPIFAPESGAWDCGRYDGGVHNGAILLHEGRFHYVYRGERPIDVSIQSGIDYMCDIGLAVSDDGMRFDRVREHSPFFRRGAALRYSYEDVNIVRHAGTYYLFCNQWDWERQQDPSVCGTFLATSRDLRRWTPRGLVFPKASRIHRNGVVLQSPTNDAVAVNGKFVMYINDGLMAFSEDLIRWESAEIGHRWPGGEGCFALAQHNPAAPEDIVLFTGGHHTGHFYAIGEVLLSTKDTTCPLAWLPSPVLKADPEIPHESGYSAEPPHPPISSFRDCVFFNGLTRHQGKWWVYYGGSEYYTCLATASAS
jgi:predicted GH43/DUF377 family glycosyl hydrolase